MPVRYRKDREKFEVSIILRGKRIRRLFKTKADAKLFDRDVNLRKLGLEGLELPYSISEAFKDFVATESAQKMLRSRKADKRYLRVAEHYFMAVAGFETIDQITYEDLQKFQLWAPKAKLEAKDEWSDSTVARCAKLLKQVFRKLERMGRIKKNPAEFWKVPHGTSGRRRPMTESEYQILYRAADEWFKPILRFMRLTGARGASVADLRWSDVLWESKAIILRSRKGGLKKIKEIRLPLYGDLEEFLRSHQKPKGLVSPAAYEYVQEREQDAIFLNQAGFPVSADTISSYGYQLIRLCGLQGLVLYGLRHAIAVDMTRAGISLETVRQGMGHSNISQTSDYARGIGLDSVAQAFEQIRNKAEKTGAE